ncbi:MAG: DUF1285 domain-containing protein [Hyphomicrobium sp.]|nr:DUF1285 domain-containing protein [Hyphomicrobium sp.]
MTIKAGQHDVAAGGLEALIKAAGPGTGPRPVESWNPPDCGDIGLKIGADGLWLYQGTPIGRMPLVKLFASILRKDADGRTYLVTPVEKIVVEVEDAPFHAVEMAVEGEGVDQSLTFRTNVDDVVTVDAEHTLRFVSAPPDGGLKPYVRVRGRLDALVTRAVYADLVALAVENDAGVLGLWSGGVWWPMA